MAPRSYPWIIVYDADCGFCKWSLARILKRDRDRRLRPLALGTPEADGLLADLSEAERNSSWHLIAPDGRRRSAGEAAPPLLRLLPAGRPFAPLLAAMPRLTDAAYRWVADHRTLLSKAISGRAKQRAEELIAGRSA
jgi:predicted DCC family thiol-disulfide oxidoreductase YuxK